MLQSLGNPRKGENTSFCQERYWDCQRSFGEQFFFQYFFLKILSDFSASMSPLHTMACSRHTFNTHAIICNDSGQSWGRFFFFFFTFCSHQLNSWLFSSSFLQIFWLFLVKWTLYGIINLVFWLSAFLSVPHILHSICSRNVSDYINDEGLNVMCHFAAIHCHANSEIVIMIATEQIGPKGSTW